MLLFLIIYIIGCILAFIILMYNESRISKLSELDLITCIIMASPSWFVVICELPVAIKNIISNNF